MLCLAKKVWISFEEWAGALSRYFCKFRGHSPQGQMIGQNGMYRTSAYPHLLRKFSDGDTTVLHDQRPHLVNELVISACWGPTGTSFALHRSAAIFESVVPFINLCDAHGIIAVNPLKLPKWFSLGCRQVSGKIWCKTAARVVPSFSQKITMRRALHIHYHSHAGCTRLTLSAGGKKMHVCAWRYPPPPYHSTPPVLH